MRPKEGRAFVLAVDFIVTEKNMKDSGYLKNRKALIMKVINYILLLIHTHDKVCFPLILIILFQLSLNCELLKIMLRIESLLNDFRKGIGFSQSL